MKTKPFFGRIQPRKLTNFQFVRIHFSSHFLLPHFINSSRTRWRFRTRKRKPLTTKQISKYVFATFAFLWLSCRDFYEKFKIQNKIVGFTTCKPIERISQTRVTGVFQYFVLVSYAITSVVQQADNGWCLFFLYSQTLEGNINFKLF